MTEKSARQEVLLKQAPVTRRAADALRSLPFSFGLEQFDCILLASMWLLTWVAFRLARLPYAFDMAALSKSYWLMPEGAAFMAIILGTLGLPLRVTLLPIFDRLRAHKPLALVLAVLALLLWRILGIGSGTVVFVDALALAELSQRCADRFGAKLLDLLVPGLYLFIGLLAVFAFNHAIVGIRYGGTADPLLSKADSAIFHANVAEIARWSFQRFPTWVFKGFDFVYFSIWSRLGAALVLVAVLGTRKDAVHFVRTILVCYCLALAVFAALPGKGPYSISRIPPAGSSSDLASYTTQDVLVNRVKKLYAHDLTPDVRQVGIGDYYISFPSLHAALPIIGLWFLRRWKRIQIITALCYCLLLPSLIFLGWHYLVDIVGGWAVAALSIALSEWISRRIEPPKIRLVLKSEDLEPAL